MLANAVVYGQSRASDTQPSPRGPSSRRATAQSASVAAAAPSTSGMSRRIVVLGGSGFIGRHVVARPAAAGTVSSLTRAAREREGAHLLPTVDVVEENVNDPARGSRGCSGPTPSSTRRDPETRRAQHVHRRPRRPRAQPVGACQRRRCRARSRDARSAPIRPARRSTSKSKAARRGHRDGVLGCAGRSSGRRWSSGARIRSSTCSRSSRRACP